MDRQEKISVRLLALREEMRREGLGAFIFPSTDPHQSEYVADCWKGREWISGFDGSAGTAVVTLTSAVLWTDSRYFLAAEEQLKGTEFQLMRLKVEGTPTIAQWLHSQLSTTDCPFTEVGIDGFCCSAAEVKGLIADLRKQGGLTLRTNLDILARIWVDRPKMPENKVEVYPLEFAGEPAHEKIRRVRLALREKHADGMLMAALDDIAWTLNLRGTDVHCTPVFVSYLLISGQKTTLYINKVKLSPEVEAYLHAEGVEVDSYENITKGLEDYFEYNILLDPDGVNYTLYSSVKREVVEAESPVARMKTVKNEAEIAGMRQAMLKDGIAMVKFLKWLSGNTGKSGISGETELSIDRKLTALRAEQPLFRGLSFDTIAAYQEHGAIVHYEATPETDIPLKPEGLLLLDSGAQYLDGTTDITRTIALGPVTEEQKKVYTLVLKGHIQVELCKFPSGASGTQLDILARQAMWREGLNYLHGTGHGVGSYLSVHEGPHQLRMEWKPAPFVAGMTVTDEPGIYLAGRFGVRIENTLLILPYKETEFGRFLQFEPLTLCPIDKAPIMLDMLTDEELRWLNDYHQTVYERLAPHLDGEECQWLHNACSPLTR
jgi:Xaa-Pro aminopeptidase